MSRRASLFDARDLDRNCRSCKSPDRRRLSRRACPRVIRTEAGCIITQPRVISEFTNCSVQFGIMPASGAVRSPIGASPADR